MTLTCISLHRYLDEHEQRRWTNKESKQDESSVKIWNGWTMEFLIKSDRDIGEQWTGEWEEMEIEEVFSPQNQLGGSFEKFEADNWVRWKRWEDRQQSKERSNSIDSWNNWSYCRSMKETLQSFQLDRWWDFDTKQKKMIDLQLEQILILRNRLVELSFDWKDRL